MRKMKDSGIEWLGNIPASWQLRQAGQLADQTKCKNEGMAEANLLSLSYGTVKRRDINATEGLLPESFESYNIIEEHDIVLRFTDLQNDQKSLRVGRATERGIITSAYTTIRPFDPRDSKYMYYALHCYDVIKGFYGMGAGVRQGLKWQEAKYIVLPYPPRDEQGAIVAFIDEKCAEIDRAIEVAEASIEEYKLYKKSVIFQCVTKGLDPDVPMRDSGIEWIGEVPASWGLVRFKNCYTVHSESGFEDEELLSVYLNRGVIRYGDSDGSQVHKPSASLEKYQLVIPGDLVMNNQQAWRGSVGVSDYRGIVSPAYHVYSPNINFDHCRSYMNYFFRSAMVPTFDVHSRGVGTIQRCIAMQYFLNEALLILPDLNEQKRIAAYLDEACLSIDGAIESKQQMIEELKAYKKSLIFETVTGKREVPCL